MNDPALPILIADDEKQILLSYTVMLRTAGIEDIKTIHDSRKVLDFLAGNEVSVIVLDLNMPHVPGTKLLGRIKSLYPDTPVIVMTAVNELETAVECMKDGAFDYLVKPVEKSRFISSVKKALEMRNLRGEVLSLREHISSLRHHILTDELKNESAFSSILTNDRKMRAVFHYIESISGSRSPVFVVGETGVGKELISKVIHDISGVTGEFVAVNVAGLDDTMFSDTLFGHEKGAYTGANAKRAGLIVKASGGTLLLDEIGDLNEFSQVKLLRLLEEGIYYPLGSDNPMKSNARIIAATNRNLQELLSEGKFRKDLYYRLVSLQVIIPPLRERIDDIPLLLDHFLDETAHSLKKKRPTYPRELESLLSNYFFPGNVRELKAMVCDAVAQHKSGMLSMDNFQKFIKEKSEHIEPVITTSVENEHAKLNFKGQFPTIKEAEEYLITEALKRSNGNQGIAASLLGLTRQALNKRLMRSKSDFRNS